MLNGEATNTNFIVFGLTYRTRGEHANHYTTDAVVISYYQLVDGDVDQSHTAKNLNF
jgi:hypothetical protein